MFSWASEHLEKLAQTVAPAPQDGAGRFVYCCQRGEESGAQECLVEFDPFGTILQPNKGNYAIHLACQYGMERLLRQIIGMAGNNFAISIQQTDQEGNTPLHYACLSRDQKTAMHMVRLLVTQFQASVVAKNSIGQTPYDVATINSVRQYLLPLQLQQETQAAIDNGGIGLPPGIDMGGLRIHKPAMPPPPTTPIAAPVPASRPHYTNSYPPVGPLTTPSPSHTNNTGPTTTAAAAAAAPPIPPAPTSTGGGGGGGGGSLSYARVGSSSAAIYSGGAGKIRPDGFHSSSSDVNLQRKYGHTGAPTSGTAAIPPPPKSGDSQTGVITMATPGAAPTATTVQPPGQVNPYSMGSVGRAGSIIGGRGRYLAYDGSTVATPAAPPPAAAVPYGFMAPPVANNFTTFLPGAPAQAQPMQVPVMPQQAQPTPYPSSVPQPFQPPAAMQQQQQQQQQQQASYQQQPTATTTAPAASLQSVVNNPVTSFLPPPPYQNVTGQPTPAAVTTSPYQPPAATVTSPYQQQPSSAVTTPQSMTSSPPPQPTVGLFAARASSVDRETSTGSAVDVFASPAKESEEAAAGAVAVGVFGSPANREVSQEQQRMQPPVGQLEPTMAAKVVSTDSSAANVFASSPDIPQSSPMEQHPVVSTGSSAADVFGAAPSNPSAAVPPVPQLNDDTSTHSKNNVTDDAGETGEDDGMMEDVPLTSPEEHVPSSEPQVAAAVEGAAPDAAASSLFNSIGLPPPPFSAS